MTGKKLRKNNNNKKEDQTTTRNYTENERNMCKLMPNSDFFGAAISIEFFSFLLFFF